MATSVQLGEAWVSLTARDGGLSGALSSVGGMASGAMGGIAAALGPIGVAAAGIAAAGAAVSAFNPALMEQIGFAFKDMFAALGSMIEPIFQAVLPGLRFLGDLFATLAPYVRILTTALGQFIEIVIETVKTLTFGLLDLAGVKVKSAAGMGGMASAGFKDIGQAGRDAMVKGLQASAGSQAAMTEYEKQMLQVSKEMKDHIKGLRPAFSS